MEEPMTKTAKKPKKKKDPDRTNTVKATIRDETLKVLGIPSDLYRVDVHLYAARKGRINVWRTEWVEPAKGKGFIGAMGKPDLVQQTHITDSFFLHLTKDGNIKSASPEIKRKYTDA
jgi:hypothetical protein